MSAALLEQLVLVAHLLLALVIIGLIMLQQGKGAEMGASFGAGASQTLFGSSGGGNVLTRATAWLVALFFASSFGLAVLAKQRTAVDDDLGIPLPAVQEQRGGEIPAADDELPALEADAAQDLPRPPGSEAAAPGAGSEIPTLEDGPGAGDVPEDDAPSGP